MPAPDKTTAAELMTREVLTVRDNMTVSELASFLLRHEVTGAAVVNQAGRLTGVVSLVDIAGTASEESSVVRSTARPSYFVRGWEEAFDEDELLELDIEEEGPLVRDIMNPATYTVEEETPVADVARMMLDGHIHRVLVTRGEEIVGIVTTSDLLRLLVDAA